MAPRFKALMYQVYPSAHGADALVCFPPAQFDSIFPFRDQLTEAILKIGGLRVKRAQGYPLPPDSIFRFYFMELVKSVEEFPHNNGSKDNSGSPNRADRALTHREEGLFEELIEVEIETSHDFPCIVVHSRCHSSESMSTMIEQVAEDLNLELARTADLGPIRSVLFSNQSFGT